MALHGIRNAQLGTVVLKNTVVFWVAPSAKRIGQNIKVGGNPFCLPLKVVLDLQGSEMARHLKADLVAGSTIFEEIETGRGVGFSGDLMPVPGGAPEVPGHDMGEEFEISDGEVLEVGRRGAGDKFIVGEIEDANTWKAVIPPIRTGVLGDVGGGGELEEGDPVAKLDGLDPPVDVLEERGVQDNIEAGRGGAAFCGEYPVKEETARRDDSGGVDKTAGEGTQLFFRDLSF